MKKVNIFIIYKFKLKSIINSHLFIINYKCVLNFVSFG